MQVEACCQALLAALLPRADPQRRGLCLDVGVGTFAFYCELFARLRFPVVAVEPLPCAALVEICRRRRITLVEACLSEDNGTATLYLGSFDGQDNPNLHSLRPDWWGATARTVEVPTVTLASLLARLGVRRVTCLKLDVEGAEARIIRQLGELPEEWLPQVVMFEYGGGGTRAQGGAGWAPAFLSETLECLRALARLGYGWSVATDSAPGSQERVLDMAAASSCLDAAFPPGAEYGNIITTRGASLPAATVARISRPYLGGAAPQPAPRRLGRALAARLTRLLRSRQ